MFKLIRTTLYVFVAIVGGTALIVLAGLVRLWFWPAEGQNDLPHLGYLLMALIAEVITVVVIFARKGLKYLPHVENHKEEADTLAFMRDFIASGSTVQIVSSRFAWIRNSPQLLDEVRKKAKEGTLVEVITPKSVAEEIRNPLADVGGGSPTV